MPNESIECPYCGSRIDITDIAQQQKGITNVPIKLSCCGGTIRCDFEKDGVPYNVRKSEDK